MIRLLVLSLALVSTPAFADGGSSVHSEIHIFSSQPISCRQTHKLVVKKDAVVFIYGADLSLFNRVVSGIGCCMHGEQLSRVSVPTRDDEDCSAGFICEITSGGQ